MKSRPTTPWPGLGIANSTAHGSNRCSGHTLGQHLRSDPDHPSKIAADCCEQDRHAAFDVLPDAGLKHPKQRVVAGKNADAV